MCRTMVLTVLVVAMAVHAQTAMAGGLDEMDRITSTGSRADAQASSWPVAENVCCHCYSTLSNGSRFYHGILEAGFCRSQQGYCEGFAKCFP
jgi:hypothetical protein